LTLDVKKSNSSNQSFSDVRVRVRVRGLLWSPSPKISDFENPISDSDLDFLKYLQ
jgi:hypothetical protein